jgi:ribonuclease D
MRILKGHLKKITGIGNWAQRSLEYTHMQYATLDAVVLIEIFNAIHKKYDWRSRVDFWISSLKDIKKHRESQIQNQNIADITGPPMTGSW